MKSRKTKPTSPRGFTLLELVVVLAILAVVTTLAVRSVGQVEDQSRYDASQRGLREIEKAVLGDFSNGGVLAGFVADMGRLPQAVAGAEVFSLRELWLAPGAGFDARPAIAANGVPVGEEDPQVLVPGGWRGPYLQLPLGAAEPLDGWGNAYVAPLGASPPNPLTSGYARLRTAADAPILSPGQPVEIVRHLGANGSRDAADAGYVRDVEIVFSEDRHRAALKGTVEVRSGTDPAAADPGDSVIVRVFGPDPMDASKIKVSSVTVPFAANPAPWEIPLAAGQTIGPRVVRAYFADAGAATTSFSRSEVLTIPLRAGVNMINLRIDR